MKKAFNKILCTLCIAFLGAILGLGGLYSVKPVQAQSITPPDGYSVHNINSGYLTIESSGKYYVYGTGEQTANETVVKGNIQVEMILDNVNVKGSSSRAYGAIRVMNGATLTIRLVGSNTLIGCNSAPGIEVSEGNTLIITSYEGDGKTTGYLKAQTGPSSFIMGSGPVGRGGAGIGAGGSYGSSTSPETLGNIIIKGGTIEAKGLHGGAGIGGAFNGSTGSIRIEGGIVRARTQEWDAGYGGGAAIGGGFCGYVPKIEITGGTVTASVANSGEDTMTGADIGAGYFSQTSDAHINFGDIIISGGNVTCNGTSVGGNDSIGFGRVYNPGYNYTYSGSVTINGGTVVANKRISNLTKVTGGSIKGTISGEPTNGMNAVSLKTITVSSAFNGQELTRLILSDGSTYNINDVVIVDTNKLYLYLPKNVKVTSATVGGIVFTNYTNADIICVHDSLSEFTYTPSTSDTAKHDMYFACCGAYHASERHDYDSASANCIKGETCLDCNAVNDRKNPDVHVSSDTYFKVDASDSTKHVEHHKCCGAPIQSFDHEYKGGSCTEQEECEQCSHKGEYHPDNHTSEEFTYKVNEGDQLKHDKLHKCCNQYVLTEGHSFVEGTCEFCEYNCSHESFVDGQCVVCAINGISYNYYEWDQENFTLVKIVKHSSGLPTEITSSMKTLTSGWYIVKGEVTFSGRVTVSGTVNIILDNGSHYSVNGLSVTKGNTLNVFARSEDFSKMGKLTSTVSGEGSAIGGLYDYKVLDNSVCGTLNFYGGIIYASATTSGAAIGAGDTWSTATQGGAISIYGGRVTAIMPDGGNSTRVGAAIGNSEHSTCDSIVIYGGTVYAIGGVYATGIGGSYSNTVESIVINGGNVYAKAKHSNIGPGSNASGGTIQDSNGKDLYLVEITLLGVEEETEIVSLGNLEYSQVNMVTQNTNKIYLYLPADKTISRVVTADGTVYSGFLTGLTERTGTFCTHLSSTNDYCDQCGLYVGDISIEKNENGYYEISTVQDFIEYFLIIKGQCLNAEQDIYAKAILLNDIDLSNLEKYPIEFAETRYRGTFDGDGYTLTVDISGGDNVAPFGSIENATIRNLVVKGTLRASGKFAGGLVSEAYGTNLIQNVLVETVIESSVSGDGTHGGIAGYIEGSTTLNNVGFTGKINGRETTSVGGFVGWVANDTILTINDSFNLGSFNVTNTSNHLIARNYDNASVTVNLNNFYYLNIFGDGSIINGIQKVEYAQVVGGEFIYLLNKGVTDGTQIWYQVVGSEEISFSTNTVYKVSCGDYEFYSNTNESHENHEFVGGACVNCNTPAMPELVEGVYQITNLGELLWFVGLVNGSLEGVEQNKNANAILLADIDLEGARWQTIASTILYNESTYNNGEYPDGGYGGTFDGNFHTVKNFRVCAEGGIKGSYGLFGTLSGTVKNLAVENMIFDLNGAIDGRVGAIVGQIIGGTVENCYVKNATITPANYVAGGIAGCNYAGVVKNCFVYDSLILGSESRYGYIVGDNRADGSESYRKGQVINCYTDGNPCVGSRVGTIENSFAVRSDEFENGAVAFNLGSAFGQEIGVDSLPVFNGAKVYKITCVDYEYYANEEKQSSDAHVFGEHFACEICGAYTEPQKQDESAYLISNASELFWYAEQVNLGKLSISKAYLTQDIDLKGVEWAPIGNSLNPFGSTGKRYFYGQGYTIKGLYVSKTYEYVGLFGNVTNGYVADLTVEGEILVKSKKTKNVGVFGSLTKTTVTNVISKVNITFDSDIKWDGYVGGIAGVVNSGASVIVEKVQYFGTIDHKNNNGTVGGIVGITTHYTSNGSSVRDTIMAGTIKSKAIGNVVIGGIIGSVNGASIQYSIFVGSIELGKNVNDSNVAAIATFVNFWRTDDLYYVGEYKAMGDSSVKDPGANLISTTLKEIYSGKIAYDINVAMWGDRTDYYYWKQDLSKQSLPDFVSGTIYQVTNCNGEGVTYSNTDSPAEHKDYTHDGDHLCEGCGIVLGECLDTEKDGDHVCDDCGEVLSECFDAETDGNHACDECGENVSDCFDTQGDDNHACDECGEILSECADAEKDGNHACDECSEIISECADVIGDGDHLCDECGKKATDCNDSSDNDHLCDECGEKVSECADVNGDGNHTCDECGEALGECADSDKNYVCDECGAELPKEGLSGGAIAGIAGGSTVGLGGLGYLVFFLLKRKEK